ncbi:hypothetical protein [Adhaeribacter rhizoryzae]|uniref:STAS/SEC14 domain-containing protein n=1 Tax=Adhaeribacter rhizoryzae TaxID=2607907 RepID=A0A5M6D2Q5_9BACT|nr:hypothetical protein [Adhaeribacter rhizoryzae]KAA5540562.1 hypothetical protein F0145_22365 [Adhaeribacter rhizoryzae]
MLAGKGRTISGMIKKELKKANGNTFFEAERKADNAYIHVNWIGIQSLEMVLLGASQLLHMLRAQPCPAILNSNKELIGPWHDGASFLGSKWALQAKNLGLAYFAHVMAPGVYGQSSFQNFYQFGHQYLQIETFTTDAEAEAWLRS